MVKRFKFFEDVHMQDASRSRGGLRPRRSKSSSDERMASISDMKQPSAPRVSSSSDGDAQPPHLQSTFAKTHSLIASTFDIRVISSYLSLLESMQSDLAFNLPMRSQME